MRLADTIVTIDWSARSTPSPRKPTKDAIFACIARDGAAEHPLYFRTRAAVMSWLEALIDAERSAGRRIWVGFDFAFGYPAGFAKALTGQAQAFAVWDWLSERILDLPDNSNNRFEIAAQINQAFPGVGPFWGCPASVNMPGLPQRGSERFGHGMEEHRMTEDLSHAALPGRAQPVWKLYTTGSVGSQTLLGLPHLNRLRKRLGAACQVWPLEAGAVSPQTPVVLCEIYPSVVRKRYATPLQQRYPNELYHIPDAEQVRAAAEAYAEPGRTARLWTGVGDPQRAVEEGWIFGLIPQEEIA